MTDYLDELLEQQEQDEQGGMPEWHRVSRFVYVGAGHETAESAERIAWRGIPEVEVARHDTQEESEHLQTEGQQRAAGLLTRQLDQLHRAVQQVREHTMQTVASARTAAQTTVAGGLLGALVSVPRAADYAAAVDAIFQRDARRYDGPLGLL